ncbi:hypothetical protein RHGRI_018558 [Rhododendron griersonianum]|uniref:Uncharacterized protein n=1 Tax=Rhododendron griersonianum TaxID=479676 RepID=A0AAV6K1X9_9ERIC|nr:hypothetical protein RHGRI_018558 [Rhododendron griersonianum]
MGMIESQTFKGYVSPRKDENTTEKTGSDDLITWVKETATLEKETQAEMWPIVWKRAGPRRAIMKDVEDNVLKVPEAKNNSKLKGLVRLRNLVDSSIWAGFLRGS